MSDVGVIPYHGGGTERQRGEAVAWLRTQIQQRLTLARAASVSGLVWRGDSEGCCVRGDDGVIAEVTGGEQVPMGQIRVLTAHLCTNDPQQVIADCETDLAVLDLWERVMGEDWAAHEDCGAASAWTGLAVARLSLRSLSHKFRHHPGYAEHWGDGDG